jgi:hypothetical protein
MAASAAEVAIVSICAGEVNPRNQPVPRAAEVPAHCEDEPRPMPPINKIPAADRYRTADQLCLVRLFPFEEAHKHVGGVKWVRGMVVRVKQRARGVHFLDFCDDLRLCPFTVVIFPLDLKSVGDVRQLQGRIVEIRGQMKEYDGRAENYSRKYRQLGGGAGIPPLPKNYDVEKKGRYSAGTFSHPKAKQKTSRKQAPNVITQAPEDPEQ